MKDNRFIKRSISFLLILTFLFSFGALTVFAEPAEGQPQDQWYDYIYSYNEDAESNYEAPAHLNDLPQASSEQVVEATAVPMPTVAVSDASLFSGIVTWLCVALGIAVVVGVLVSKRTRRRGA